MEVEEVLNLVKETARKSTEETFNKLMVQHGHYFKNKPTKVSVNLAHKVTGLSRTKIITAIETKRVDGGFIDSRVENGRGTYWVNLIQLEEHFGLKY